MRGGVHRLAIAASHILLAAIIGGGNSAAAADDIGSAMRENGWAAAPIGHLDFCQRDPGECVARGQRGAVPLDEERWQDLTHVNLFVNASIAPITDLDLYQDEEVWTVPDSEGDCEDYVLLKRKLLVERGWPTGALLVTVVFDEVGDGHAVLLARTDQGELVLDNKVDAIRLWHQTGYRFVKRQSVSDPQAWVYLGDPRPAASATAAQ